MDLAAEALRTVIHGDGVEFVRGREFRADETIVTSMPDVSEVSLSIEAWKEWFVETSRLLCEKVAPTSLVVFYQTDIKRDGEWIDKGYLVSRGAELASAKTLFHKIVCRAPPGTVTFGRPAYAHILGFSRELRFDKSQSSADVLPVLGEMTWARAMGRAACDEIARMLVAFTETRVVVDPFCGVGTMLAVAEEHGLSSLGCELSRKRADQASRLRLKGDNRGKAALDESH